MVFPHTHIPLYLAETIIPMVAAKWWFSNSVIIPFTFVSSYSTIRKSSLSFPSFLPSLFIHLVLSYGFGDSYFIQCIINCYIHYLFWYPNCPRIWQGESFQACFCVLLICPLSFEHSRLILYLFCPSSGISHFLKKLVLVPFGRDFKIWAWSVPIVVTRSHCLQSISVDRAGVYVYIPKHTLSIIYQPYVYIYLSMKSLYHLKIIDSYWHSNSNLKPQDSF